MRLCNRTLLMFPLAFALVAAEAAKVGHKKFSFGSESGHLWYPTDSDAEPKAQRYHPLPVYASIRTVEDAGMAPGRRPLILLSHGILGEATSYAWLSALLAADGALVAAPDHDRQSRSDFEEPELFRFYRRALTLSATLDRLLADPGFAAGIDPDRIFVIGHSVGGQSALSLAGGIFDLDAVLQGSREALTRSRLADRMVKAFAAQPPSPGDLEAGGRSYRDARFKKVVLLDPVPVWPGFREESLRSLGVPVLYIGCSHSEIFDSDAVKAALGRSIPDFRSEETGAGHFVFANTGTWLGRLLRPEAFRDRDGVDRDQVHGRVHAWISDFLGLAPSQEASGR